MMRRALFAFSFLVFGCSTPNADQRVVATPPDRASFPAVSQMLLHRCGSLDCHGTPYRNFKIYGSTGLRVAPGDRPSSTSATTTDEIDQTYASLLGLEPELMTAVVTSGGANPERLTFVRKARGTEDHKGGGLVIPGDDQDVCITSWLAGHADAAACARALSAP